MNNIYDFEMSFSSYNRLSIIANMAAIISVVIGTCKLDAANFCSQL
jgi:hypothetical protein